MSNLSRVLTLISGLAVFFIFTRSFHAQLADKTSLHGVIDFHAHSDPDSLARSVNVFELAQKAREAGMRGFVLKNHHTQTAGYAYLARLLVPGLEIFGGVAMNRSVGGINPT